MGGGLLVSTPTAAADPLGQVSQKNHNFKIKLTLWFQAIILKKLQNDQIVRIPLCIFCLSTDKPQNC